MMTCTNSLFNIYFVMRVIISKGWLRIHKFKPFSRMKNSCFIIISLILTRMSEIYLINGDFKSPASFMVIVIFNHIVSSNFSAIWYNIILILASLFNKHVMFSFLIFTQYFKVLTIYKLFNSFLLLIMINETWMTSLLLISLYSFEDKFWNIILWILSEDLRIF